MKFIDANREELTSFLVQNDGPLQQSWQWGELQEQMGRAVLRKLLIKPGEPLLAASFVRHDLPLGKYYWLCTKGPVLAKNFQISNLPPLLLPLIKGEMKRGLGGPIFIRIEPEIFADHEATLREAGLVKAPKDHSPKATILLDLRQNEEDLLRRMHPKTRYNIGLAQQKELRIKNYELGELSREMWGLFIETARRGGFNLHPKKYYQEMFKLKEVKLFTAGFQGKLVAAAVVSVFGGRATYLHGASDYESRALMAPYLLHWQIIRELKAQGVLSYDFGGVGVEGQTDHPLASLNRFKAGFGGQYVEYVGSWDYVMSPIWYGIYKMARKIKM